ncbi:MAG: hypothetical protein H6835_13175 [Planctomycetes bacterium]|nr:hypothetical protein [Planctomycetota bacterium]
MDSLAALPLVVPLPRPQRGDASRAQFGNAELVLERARGGYSLLWSNGREARRYVLGLGPQGHLQLELRAPRFPLHLVPRETLTLVPGARLSGYVTAPLVPTLVWKSAPAAGETLFELHPPELQGQWEEDSGHAMRCAVSWMVRFPMRSGEPRVVLPLRLRNAGNQVVTPGRLRVRITDADLTPMRGSVVTRPHRIVFGEAPRPVAVAARHVEES